MARKPKQPPEVADLFKAVSKFTKQTDRGSALIASAWVDDSLGTYLRSALYPDGKWIDDVFQPDNILGSFSSRIKMAFLFRLIDENAKDDLETIRRIRNDFAHVREPIKFTDQSIRDKCKQLNGVGGFELGSGIIFKSPKQRFLVTAVLLSEHLLELSKDVEHPQVKYFDYVATIRRRSKSAMLKYMVKYYDKSKQESE